jgi:NADPH-dependent curcumin reductase CurA
MSVHALNRQWLLIERPTGMVGLRHFAYREEPVPVPQEGEVLVRTLYLSFDPAMRAFLNGRPSYAAPQRVGEVMRAGGIAQVIESRTEGFAAGDLVSGGFGWQDYATADPALGVLKLSPTRQLTDYMSVLGGTGLTAYVGLLEVGRPNAGDTVVISGAAGATGSTAVQIARILGCRTIAIAGGPQKCRWTVDALGAAAAIDYKSQDVAQCLTELCPDGIDVYFDNVGGSTLQAAIGRMKTHGRIALCGMISAYNDATPTAGPSNLFELIARRVRMEGFLVPDFAAKFPEARRALEAWLDEGKLKAFVDVQEGFENIPQTFLRIFTGANVGKQTLKLADPVLPVPGR